MGQAGWGDAVLLAAGRAAHCPGDGIVRAPGDEQPREQRGPRGRVQVMWGARGKLGRLVHGPKKGGPGVFGDWDVWLDLGS